MPTADTLPDTWYEIWNTTENSNILGRSTLEKCAKRAVVIANERADGESDSNDEIAIYKVTAYVQRERI